MWQARRGSLFCNIRICSVWYNPFLFELIKLKQREINLHKPWVVCIYVELDLSWMTWKACAIGRCVLHQVVRCPKCNFFENKNLSSRLLRPFDSYHICKRKGWFPELSQDFWSMFSCFFCGWGRRVRSWHPCRLWGEILLPSPWHFRVVASKSLPFAHTNDKQKFANFRVGLDTIWSLSLMNSYFWAGLWK